MKTKTRTAWSLTKSSLDQNMTNCEHRSSSLTTGATTIISTWLSEASHVSNNIQTASNYFDINTFYRFSTTVICQHYFDTLILFTWEGLKIKERIQSKSLPVLTTDHHVCYTCGLCKTLVKNISFPHQWSPQQQYKTVIT